MSIVRKITQNDINIFRLNPVKHELKQEIINNIYPSGDSDTWQCSNCSEHGDKWQMMGHYCPKYYQFHENTLVKKKENKPKVKKIRKQSWFNSTPR